MAADALALLDHLGVGRYEVFGYSMGTRTALQMALDAPDRIDLMLGGIGGKLFDPPRPGAAEAMQQGQAGGSETISEPFLKSFRQFADEQGEDRQALAAMSAAQSPAWDQAALARRRCRSWWWRDHATTWRARLEALARAVPMEKESACPDATTSRRSRTPR